MNKLLCRRMLSLVLLAALLLSLLPTSVLATETASFVLVAETNSGLVIAPEYVTYTQGQTIREALMASDHTFLGIEDDWITEIDGVTGNFTRSDEHGGFNLNAPASEVKFFRFSEELDGKPSEGLQRLMTVMATYKQKTADVQAAAKEAYDTAYSQFVGLDSGSATSLAIALEQAIGDYEENQAGQKHKITFSDGQNPYTDATITAENPYGKVWEDDGDGVLELPCDNYTFRVSRDGLGVNGRIEVTEDATITVSLPTEKYLVLENFRLSGSYGSEYSEENKFTDDEFTLAPWTDRYTTVTVSDTFMGTVYAHVEYDSAKLDKTPTLTAIYRSAKTGEEVVEELPFMSWVSGNADMLDKGAAGNTVVYRLTTAEINGYVYTQDYTVEFLRMPTLASLRVSDQRGVDQTANMAFDGNVTSYTYKVVDSVTAVTVKAQPLEPDYQVTIGGQDATEGVTIPLENDEETTFAIQVEGNGFVNTYTIAIRPGEGRNLSFVTEREDVTLEVVNANGEVLPYEKFKEGSNGNRYQYVLVPGETYSYVATAETYYHVADEFTMEDVADSTIRVDVPTEDWMSVLAFGTKQGKKYKDDVPLDTAFDPADHTYAVRYVDTEHNIYVWMDSSEPVTAKAHYNQKFASTLYHDQPYTIDLDPGKATGVQLKRFLMDENPHENVVTIRLTQEKDGHTIYQDYVVEVKRSLTLENLSTTCQGVAITLVQPNNETGFKSDVKEYSVKVSMTAGSLRINAVAHNGNLCPGDESLGYRIKVNGEELNPDGSYDFPLTGTIETQDVTITVENDKAPDGTEEYILHVLKSPPVDATFTLNPGTALLTVYETMSGQRLWPDEKGTFQFCEGYSYNYSMTTYGYVSKTGTLSVTRDENNALVVKDGETTYPVTEVEGGGGAATIAWSLTAAEKNHTLQPELPSFWPNFRGQHSNNAVTDARIPTTAEEGTLYWANKLGDGIDANAVGSPILVNGEIITYAGDKIYRVDPVNGQVLAVGDMDHKSSFSITPPTYAEGMIFVALSNGTVQAFNAVTLESLWLFKDPLGGQPNCPLTVHNGYLYTGFWNSETGNANFVCLTITDEDPAQVKESKCASWFQTAKGGYYWAGAYACDDFVLIGTDDGTSGCTNQTSSMLALNPCTGEILDRWDGLDGDIRSTVAYDSQTDAYYFTSKGGTFYSLQMTQTEAGWEMTDSWSVKLNNNSDNPPMSTCTPSVYNGRAYVGVSGSSQFGAYSGHNITVIDLQDRAIAYSVQTQGYPQTSGLLTTAYEEESGYVYIYFIDNMTPGKLRVLRDKPGQTSADYLTTEGSYTTAYALFTPTGEQAQYAICSPIVDEYGTVYFKNDSAHLMAFGSTIERIVVTKMPDKTAYADGEAFDPTGMVVTATYANGKQRDITKYVTFDLETITKDQTTVTITFPYVMYHNQENGTAMSSGITTTTPVTTLQVTIGGESGAMGDVNQDGTIDILDANMVVSHTSGSITLTEEQLLVADVNGDDIVNILDANLIVSYWQGIITDFGKNT